MTVINELFIYTAIQWIQNVSYYNVIGGKYIIKNGVICSFTLQLHQFSRAHKSYPDICLSAGRSNFIVTQV